MVFKSSEKASEEELLQYLGKKVHHFFAPKRILFLDELPKTSTGKTAPLLFKRKKDEHR